MVSRPCTDFWYGKRVVLTGHTGFKGGWLALWLQQLGAEVTGIALAPSTVPSLFACAGIGDLLQHRQCDIRNPAALACLIHDAAPHVVLHLAAQPLVRASYKRPLDTFSTNVMGTANVLDALRDCASVRVALVITTDKVYRNPEQPFPFRESDPLGGHDPYSASKAAAEIVVASYRDAFLAERGIAVATARAGNVIGGGDWSQDRLLPDALRAWQTGNVLDVRRPAAVRPWQHVLEPLAGYLRLVEHLWQTPAHADAYNFGPTTSEAATVRTVVEIARQAYGKGEVAWGDGGEGPHEAGWLALETAKVRMLLGLVPRWQLREAVTRTVLWHRLVDEGGDARALCKAEICAYEAAT